MKFRFISDIHNEFLTDHGEYRHYDLPVMEGENEMCLLMAGDIGLLDSPRTYETFIDEMCKRFKCVFWTEGNHEFYHGNIDKHSVENIAHSWTNLHTGELPFNDEKIVVLGCTLWTDFDKGSPVTLWEANSRMNDHRIIRRGTEYSKFRAENAMALHHAQKKQLFKDIAWYKNEGYKVVVVTHHHPSFKGVSTEYIGDSLNGAYCSEFPELMVETKPDFWFCGHIHEYKQYDAAFTKVICNPRGYPWEKTGFKPMMTLTLTEDYDFFEESSVRKFED